MQEAMRDAAFAVNLAGWGGAVAGYYGGPNAFRVWTEQDWAMFKGVRKLPIWVGGMDGHGEAVAAVQALFALGVTPGAFTVLDMEARVDKTYVNAFGAFLDYCGFKVWVYGSANTVFSNPSLNGYWVADYAGVGPFMFKGPAGTLVRATQYANGQKFDSSTVKPWTYAFGKWWR